MSADSSNPYKFSLYSLHFSPASETTPSSLYQCKDLNCQVHHPRSSTTMPKQVTNTVPTPQRSLRAYHQPAFHHPQLSQITQLTFRITDPMTRQSHYYHVGQIIAYILADTHIQQNRTTFNKLRGGYTQFIELFNTYSEPQQQFATFDLITNQPIFNNTPIFLGEFNINSNLIGWSAIGHHLTNGPYNTKTPRKDSKPKHTPTPFPFPDKNLNKHDEDDELGAAAMMVIIETPKEDPLDIISTKNMTN